MPLNLEAREPEPIACVCGHRNIKSVNCELFCIDCGASLPADFFARGAAAPSAKKEPAGTEKPAETAKKPTKRTTKKSGSDPA